MKVLLAVVLSAMLSCPTSLAAAGRDRERSPNLIVAQAGDNAMWPWKSKQAATRIGADQSEPVAPKAVRHIAAAASGKDPAGRAILGYLMDAHPVGSPFDKPTVMSALGALAGFSAQIAIRDGLVATGKRREDDVLVTAKAPNGEVYYYGDMLNLMVAEHERSSIWAYVAEGVRRAGGSEADLPDLTPIFKRTAESVGTPRFGIPVVDPRFAGRTMPRALVDRHWVSVRAILEAGKVDPESWPGTIAAAARVLICTIKEDIPPAASARILMEAAIPMSKLDWTKVPGARR